MRLPIVTLLVVLTISLTSARASVAQEAAAEAETFVVKVYRVVDLVVPAPSYPYEGTYLPAVGPATSARANRTGMGGGMGGMGGGMGGGVGGGMFQVADPRVGGNGMGGGMRMNTNGAIPASAAGGRPAPSNRIDMDSLIEAITTIIEPSSWDEVGGPGAVTPIGGALAVHQTPANQTKVEEFLDALRRENGSQQVLTTEAQWLSLSREQLASIQGQAADAATVKAGTPLDAAAVAALPDEARRYSGQITCFNGQTVHLISGRIESAVVGAIPLVGTDTAYQPLVAEPHLGVLLEITPAALPDNEGVLLDLHSTITHRDKPGKPRPISNSDGTSLIEIDQVNIAAQQFATSLRMPAGKPVLIGGINFPDTKAGSASPASDEGQGLYLVVTVRTSP